MLGRTLIGIRVVAVVAVVAEMSVQLRYMESGALRADVGGAGLRGEVPGAQQVDCAEVLSRGHASS